MVHNTLPYGHAPTYQISLTYLERQKCYDPDMKILFKKQLFDLEVKGHYGMRHTTLWSCTHIPNKYYLKNNYLTLRSKAKVTQRSLRYATPPYGHAPTYQISLTYLERQKFYGSDKKILFKKQLFDLQVRVPQRSLWYTTHCLMVMDPHTKYH